MNDALECRIKRLVNSELETSRRENLTTLGRRELLVCFLVSKIQDRQSRLGDFSELPPGEYELQAWCAQQVDEYSKKKGTQEDD
jgi:hypothetical protein